MSKKAMKLALEALNVAEHFVEEYAASKYYFAHISAKTALEEALAKQEQPIKEVVVNANYREMWKQQVEMNQQLTAALSAQPAKQEQGEPVAWCVTYNKELTGNIYENKRIAEMSKRNLDARYGTENAERAVIPIYTTPQQRKPLTDEQIAEMWDVVWEVAHRSTLFGIASFVRAIEAAHGIYAPSERRPTDFKE